jgi:hypothetical protein
MKERHVYSILIEFINLILHIILYGMAILYIDMLVVNMYSIIIKHDKIIKTVKWLMYLVKAIYSEEVFHYLTHECLKNHNIYKLESSVGMRHMPKA